MNFQGMKIIGKWNKNIYIVEGLVGVGGVGKVYKVYDIKNREYYALKISTDLHSITKESNMLDRFNDLDCIPKVIDIDDYEIMGETYYFIVLEYINGETLKEYIRKHRINIKKLLGIIIVVGEMISKFHKKGYVFGDLKPENIMIDKVNKKIKIIDLGGVVKTGSSLREFTPMYDRAKWNMGLRRADPGYDLFSICMLLTCAILENNKKMFNMNIYEIIHELKRKKVNKKLINLLANGLVQNETDFSIFLKKIKEIYKNCDVDSKIRYKDKINLVINVYLIGSLVCFITLLFFLISSNW